MSDIKTNNFKCILCGKSGIAKLVSPKLRDDQTQKFKVYSCSKCDHVQIFPIPTPGEEEKFYNNDQQTRNLIQKIDINSIKKNCLADTQRRLEWIKSTIPKNSKTLDVGCGYGFLVDSLNDNRYNAFGLDISSERLSYVQNDLKGNFIQSKIDQEDINNKYNNKFNLVSAFHVLEHVSNPVNFIKNCMDFIKPGGYLLIEVPNLNDESLTYIESYKTFYWQRAHLSYFDPEHLKIALSNSGIKSFCIKGVQRYSVENLFNWINEGKPQISFPIYRSTHPLLSKIDHWYKKDREQNLTCDTLIATILK